MNSAVVIFLDEVVKVERVVKAGIVLRDMFTPVYLLENPSKKITVSNAPPFIKNDDLYKALSRRSPCSHQYRSGGTLEKTITKQFCQQYNRNVTKQITRSLQDLETEVQHLLSCTGDQGHVEALKSKKAAIANLLGITAQGALVRSRFMNASMLDSPSKFFFSLESRNGQRKVIHCLRSDNGSSLTEATEIRRYATGFYRDLFKTESVEDPELDSTFLSDLPQAGDSSDSLLSADLTLDELHVALMNLAKGKAPGIDGIPVDFYKALLAGGDYKVLSKALALRLREVMAEVVHVDQTYCVPGRLISDNVNLIQAYFGHSTGFPQAVLFLPKEEGGQGLVHLASRCAAFRLQFIHEDLVWRPLAQLTLQSVSGPKITGISVLNRIFRR
ncbi:hypothetical protein L3Q82_020350 [Scortum barcoo]|uniref:Uncharacterized protein n=1 Tax=Scortum barcoo TaxID=214431 RepID=A0ACB8V786_9TELE|nr:hypothetical protein L3Q82_020350 [Scortum barcoo]